MTLYYRKNNVLKCKEIDYMKYKGPKGDRIEMIIIGGEYPEIGVYAGAGVFGFYYSGKMSMYHNYDCIGCYYCILSDLIKQHVVDFNDDAIDLIIGRVENTIVSYLEMCKHIGKLLTQPDSKSACNF